ncbi:hypothetical protein [Nannocystis pusilla]|uniref:hypothetical protein n=1 Tax=Nannocystis pusilla TaxID=889268 RepID=UPI003B824950
MAVDLGRADEVHRVDARAPARGLGVAESADLDRLVDALDLEAVEPDHGTVGVAKAEGDAAHSVRAAQHEAIDEVFGGIERDDLVAAQVGGVHPPGRNVGTPAEIQGVADHRQVLQMSVERGDLVGGRGPEARGSVGRANGRLGRAGRIVAACRNEKSRAQADDETRAANDTAKACASE